MREDVEALHELARTAIEGPAARGTLPQAASVIRRATGAAEALVVYAEDQDFLVCADAGDGAGTEFTQVGLWVIQRQILELDGPVAFNLVGHRVEDFAGASSDDDREFLALAVPTSQSASEMCMLRGPWKHKARARILRIMESAIPALTIILERSLNGDRSRRQGEQLHALANAAQVLTRSEEVVEAPLTNLATAIAASTGFEYIVNMDLYDATTDRFFLRVLSQHRHTSGTLAQIWRASLNPDRPDVWNTEVMRTSRPRLTPDLQNDERMPKHVRAFFTRSLLRSSAVFPLLFHDEFLGTISFVSFKPRTFPPEEVSLLQGFVTQAATALKALQMHRELQRYTSELRRSTDEYIATTNLTGEIIGKVDKYGNWTFLNDAACQFYGKSREELLGTDSKNNVHPEDVALAIEAVQKAGATREPISGFVNRQITPMGTRVVEWNASPFFDEEGQYAGIQMTGRDITERERAEEALRGSEERFRDIAENADEWIWEVDGTGKYTYASPVVERVLGYEPEELLGKHFYDLFHPEDREELKQAAFEVFEERQTFREFVNRNIHKNGKAVWLSTSGVPILDQEGNLLGYRGADTDITERKRAEEALQESERRFRSLSESAPIGIFLTDSQGNCTYANPRLLSMAGLTLEESLGRGWAKVIHPDDRQAVLEEASKAPAEGRDFAREFRLLTAEGELRSVQVHSTPMISADGERAGRVGTLQDITERKRAEEALRQSEEKHRDLVENISEVIYSVDEHGVVTYVSPTVEQLAGYSASEATGRALAGFVYPDDLPAVIEDFQKGLSGNPEPFECRILSKSGDIRWIRTSRRPIFEGNRIVGVRGVLTDISERKRAEEALRESEEEFRLVFENAKDAILWADAETGLITRCNRAAESLLEKERAEIVGQHHTIVHPPEKAQYHAEMFKRHIEQEGYSDDEAEIITKSGRVVPAHIAASVTEVAGRPIIQGIFRDITEWKRAEEALRESEGRYRLLAENASDVIWTMDLGLRYTYVSPSIARMRGYSVEEVIGKTVQETMTPASLEVARKTLAEELAIERMDEKDTSRSTTLELEMYCKDGSTVWCEMTMTFLRDPDGQAIGILGVSRDISERKKAEKELRESEEHLRTLVTNAPVILFAVDREGIFTLSEGKGLEGLGLRPGEVVGRSVLEVFGESTQIIGYMHRALDGEPLTVTVDLGGLTFETYYRPVRDHDGEIAGGIGVAVDISERKRAEEAVGASEERYRLLAENATDIIWTMDLGLKYTYVSPSVTRMRGYSVEEVMGQTVNESMTPASREVAMKTLAEELAMERMEDKVVPRSRTLELEMNCRDGSTVWCEMNMTFLRDPDGRPVGILGVTRDISERKKAEEEQERLHAELELRAITDSLTGLYDHAHFYQRLGEELERSRRYNHGFAVVMMDIDDFKRFNDSRGHHVGDDMLRLVGDCIRSGLRRSDVAFRYGGDEFAAILPHANSSKARAVINRINGRIAKSLKQTDDGPAARMRLSAGVACFPDDGTTADDLVRVADAALYSAKWVMRARDIMGQREDIQSFVSALVNRRAGVEDPLGGAVFRPEALHEEQARIVSSVSGSIAVALKDAGVPQALEDPDVQIVAVVGAAAEIKDRYIRGHPERTSEQAVAVAEQMGLAPERVRDIRIAGLLHDIGKVSVSESILNKPGKLTRREFATIKDHPVVGATLVSQLRGFEQVVPIVRHHHERFDGTGYPDGLAAEDIPLEARILGVADVYDAMTHQRAYRKALSKGEAVAELERGAGTQFDPAVVKAFVALVGRGAREAATSAQAAT